MAGCQIIRDLAQHFFHGLRLYTKERKLRLAHRFAVGQSGLNAEPGSNLFEPFGVSRRCDELTLRNDTGIKHSSDQRLPQLARAQNRDLLVLKHAVTPKLSKKLKVLSQKWTTSPQHFLLF